MGWKQVRTPNTRIPYMGGECEGFAEGTVGQASLPTPSMTTTYGVFSSASVAWKNVKGKHPGEMPPKGVAVAVYFSLGSTRYGHVAVHLADGRVISSTMPGYHSRPYIHSSLNDLISVYAQANNGCKYLGWSEYIGNAQVVKYIQPAPAGHKVATVTGQYGAYVRKSPSTASAVAGTKWLKLGATFYYSQIVTGQNVRVGTKVSNKWYKSSLGHYVWAGNCKG